MTAKQKDCPRCGGNLLLDQEEYDRYLCCLQCGYRIELTGENESNYQTTKGRWETLPSTI